LGLTRRGKSVLPLAQKIRLTLGAQPVSEVRFISTPELKFFSFEPNQRFCGCNRGLKIHCISNAQHGHFQSLGSSKTPGVYGRLPYLGIARCFEISPFNGCSAPVTRYRCARLVALSSSSNKLASGDSDGWIYALVSLSRVAFEFLTLAVRGS
jgi:hypothetical protein